MDVPVLNINDAGNGVVVLIAVGAFYYVPLYAHMRYDGARAALAARFTVNGFRDINVALHSYIYAKTIPYGCAIQKIIADATVNYLASLISMR
jgi:hypothetical protein